MPSLQVGLFSGGVALVSGNPFSGTQWPVGGINLKVDGTVSGTGLIYVSLPFPGLIIPVSGMPPTLNSGGGQSSGGLMDGWQLGAGETLNIPKIRLVSGIQSIRLTPVAATSGTRVFWEVV